eukprot:CAMPEP_0184694886 /NCGR_PEP_ID=MMETSP0313-20130426/2700_1 /TAXON_ID=2792 /ORGANISM="Porphyridium aerugineum, Strain SAG 1380-2" /LENGTH=241 /DNA_ID=CAMNT_0027153247 /DNA_START=253 /DNA_END=978 /DNA_ORIENTATION=+
MALALSGLNDVAAFLKLTNGRDKLFRFFQYLARAIKGSSAPKSILYQNALLAETALASSRQTFRLLKWINVAALQMAPSQDRGPMLDILHSFSELCLFLWFFFDNLSWLAKVGLIPGKAMDYTRRGARFWMTHCILNTFCQLITLSQLRKRVAMIRNSKKYTAAVMSDMDGKSKGELMDLENQSVACLMDVFRSAPDILVSYNLSLMPQDQFSPALIGCTGVFTSAVGIVQNWPKKLILYK